jgi:hypothetical protein
LTIFEGKKCMCLPAQAGPRDAETAVACCIVTCSTDITSEVTYVTKHNSLIPASSVFSSVFVCVIFRLFGSVLVFLLQIRTTTIFEIEVLPDDRHNLLWRGQSSSSLQTMISASIYHFLKTGCCCRRYSPCPVR